MSLFHIRGLLVPADGTLFKARHTAHLRLVLPADSGPTVNECVLTFPRCFEECFLWESVELMIPG